MIVEELVSKLGLEVDSGALGLLEKFRSAVSGGLAGLVTAAGAVSVAFVGIVANAAHAADEIGDMADKLGVSTKALQELRVAASLSDVSFEALTTGLKFVAKNASEAAKGSKEAMASFAGVALRDGNGKLKTADELLVSVADRFKNIKDPIEQTALAMKVFGRSGIDLVPLLKKGGAAIAELRKEAEELGAVFDQDTIEAADDLGHQLERVKFATEGLRNTFAKPFVPLFDTAAKKLVQTLKDLRPLVADLAKSFADAGQRIGSILETVMGLGRAFGEWLGSFGFMRRIIDGFSAWFEKSKVLEASLIGLGVVLAAVAATTLVSWLLAAAPFVLLAALIGFIVDDINGFIKGQDSVLGRLEKWAHEMDPDSSPIIKFFKTALALLFDFTNPARWDAFISAVQTAAQAMQIAFGLAAIGIGQALTKYLSQAALDLAAKFPWLAMIPGFMSGAVATAGLNASASKGLEATKGALGALGSYANPFREKPADTATAPQAFAPDWRGGTGASVMPQVTVNVNGSGLTPEETEAMVRRVLQTAISDAAGATSGGPH